ncbi:hypothetical protein RDV64_06725 [Acuticoccus sp. MNP-M23]|uniref:hypothetical protein n=1 Tax=Acuticoccus sp. MNP-M23 TaxID=3072793 RepID=UPI00281606AF|nr:hypothetical protein [Acuticoccus sp. MNP-M23]WMS44079.1 hypothetical protein RDV64_06725 [Acuticoccus sp. MNP-M23]
MRRNRFEIVDEVQDDAITLELAAGGDPEMARVHVPGPGAAPAEDGTPAEAEKVSEPLARKDAFRGAIQLANTMKMPVVVMGDDAAWDPMWGDLYRPV